jgi:hypothetical protein
MNHLGALRLSLLVAIGAVPVACGGTVSRGDEGEGNSSSGSGGSSNTAGSKASAGKPSVGTSGSGGTVGKMLPPTGGRGGGGTIPDVPTCTNSKLDALTGLVYCSEGYEHRPKPIRCEGFGGAPTPSGGADGLPRASGDVDCEDLGAGGASREGICEQFELGFCRSANFDSATCESGCVADEDCGPGFLCECGHAESPSGGVCVGARDCTTNADCGPDSLCAAYDGPCGARAFACFSEADECRSGADCGGSSCSFYQGFRACDDAICGRPFLVESSARMAAIVASDEWCGSGGLAPHVDHLTAQERANLAQHWARMGQMEHASIAAFARFNLQLLSLGAPPALVDACTRALADETAHTKLCFELASAYAGRALGPGRLDVDGSLAVTSLVGVVQLVIAEGCFGETVAALEAREAADGAADPVIRAAYSRIARDEQRHAELAFQFIRWALERDRASVSACIEAALHGAEARPDVLRAVVEPCFAALLAQAA